MKSETVISADRLAAEVKAWRGKVPAWQAAELLGIPKRTLQNLESGRGFPYPQLLRHAMRAVKVPEKEAKK